MCILILKPAGRNVSKKTLRQCFKTNPHGTGFAYVNTDNRGISRVTVKKSMTFSKFYKQYKKALGLAPESNFIIHFRISTGGVKSEFNNHPFMIKNRKVAFGHNGIIQKVVKRQRGEENDTRAFNREILKKLPANWYKNKALCELVGEYIGYSKLVVLNNQNEYAIINESSGSWDGDVWYSNSSYKVWKPIPTTTTTYNSYKRKPSGGGTGQHYPYSTVPTKTHDPLYECSYCDKKMTWSKAWYTELSGMTCVCSECKKFFIQRNHLQEQDFSINPIGG